MTFNKRDLARFEGFGLPDLIGEGCRLLFVGINPGLWTAAAGVHFAHPSNRFWPAMRKAGLIDFEPSIRPVAASVPIVGPEYPGQPPFELWSTAGQADARDASNRRYPALRRPGPIDFAPEHGSGMADGHRRALIGRGIGITNLVHGATARAAELSRDQLRVGGERLRDLVDRIGPGVVAVAGVTAYRDAFGDTRASLGRQPEDIGAAESWVVPNPSGLNAHETIDSLAGWYRKVAEAAGTA